MPLLSALRPSGIQAGKLRLSQRAEGSARRVSPAFPKPWVPLAGLGQDEAGAVSLR